MKLFLLIVLLSFAVGNAVAQTSPAAPVDTISMHPNTIRVTGQVLSSAKRSAALKIEQVVGTGMGIVNSLAEGGEITIQLPEDESKLVANEKVTVDLREKIGVDASMSTYVLIRVIRLKRAK